jgi:NADH:ubiquinone oxidoreductase subunit E
MDKTIHIIVCKFQSVAAIVSELVEREGTDRSRLIPLLNALQDHHGYLPADEIKSLARLINVSLSKIWGVMTFYSHYKLEPPAKYGIRVCSGTACHVKNSGMLRDTFVKEATIEDYSIEEVACLGCCALAPVFEVNGEIHAAMSTKKVRELIHDLEKEDLDGA